MSANREAEADRRWRAGLRWLLATNIADAIAEEIGRFDTGNEGYALTLGEIGEVMGCAVSEVLQAMSKSKAIPAGLGAIDPVSMAQGRKWTGTEPRWRTNA